VLNTIREMMLQIEVTPPTESICIDNRPLETAFKEFESKRDRLLQFVEPLREIANQLHSIEREPTFFDEEKRIVEQLQDRNMVLLNIADEKLNISGQMKSFFEESSLVATDEQLFELTNMMNNGVSILVLGDVKAGKSAFINALLGSRILPSTSIPCTSTIVSYLVHSNKIV
jgi:ATPase subunit of ABC transporter with duplicated ATPase domains